MLQLPQVIVLALLASAQIAWATQLSPSMSYYPENFYRQVESGAKDKTLLDLLHEVLDKAHQSGGQHDTLVGSCSSHGCYQHTDLGYKQARRILFGELHLVQQQNSYAILDLYCEKLMTDVDFHSQPPGPGQIPDANVLNAEHTWPQSRFSGGFNRGMQKSDLHNLFPVSSMANSRRGNTEFSDVVTEVDSPCPASKRGYNSNGDGGIFFEVPESHKGNVARAIFYFSIRYRLPISRDEEVSLKAWHRKDPADQAERTRNDMIFSKQKVRNPFIDYAELVEMIQDF